MKVVWCGLFIPALLICGDSPRNQLLVVDRGPAGSGTARSVAVRRTQGSGFVGDHFRIGESADVWIIDTIRIWVLSGNPPASETALGNLLESISLFGGIEAAPPPPGQPPQPECDCHNLMTIKTAQFRPGTDELQNGDIVITRGGGALTVDFQNLHWSVPGGVDLQFGAMGKARREAQPWIMQATTSIEPHQLKLFDEKGKLEGPYAIEDRTVALNVQVWAHKSAAIKILSAASTIEVAIHSEGGFDPSKADPSTLRFGPGGAAPLNTRVETIEGRTRLVARFRRSDSSVPNGVVSVCLTGRQHNGVPFEGCDLISSK
jgi:hypothetical protein